MTEKVYKTMKAAGAANIAIGVICIVIGVASGVILLVSGGSLLKEKKKLKIRHFFIILPKYKMSVQSFLR